MLVERRVHRGEFGCSERNVSGNVAVIPCEGEDAARASGDGRAVHIGEHVVAAVGVGVVVGVGFGFPQSAGRLEIKSIKLENGGYSNGAEVILVTKTFLDATSNT